MENEVLPAEKIAELEAFEQLVHHVCVKVTADLTKVPAPLRVVSAGSAAIQLIANLIGCTAQEATLEWLKRVMRPAVAPLVGADNTVEKRLIGLTADLAAFRHLCKEGHSPKRVYDAIVRDLKISHDLFNAADSAKIIATAIDRSKLTKRLG